MATEISQNDDGAYQKFYDHRDTTTKNDWERGDAYHNSFLFRDGEEPAAALENNDKNEIPNISVSAAQGKYLKLLVQAIGAKRVLEIGMLGGYSTIWMAQGLPAGGEITTLEINQKHADVAAENFDRAGVTDKIKVIVGPATESLKTLEPNPPFDFMFIDADKSNIPTYLSEAKRLLRKGGIAVIDNVNRHGKVSNPEYSGPDVQGIRDVLEVIKNDPEVEATTMGMAGEKGYDGYMFIVKQ